MQRVTALLRKLTALSEQPGPKAAIDVDLMLDYTRVLYADLLEWKEKAPLQHLLKDEPTLEEVAQAMQAEEESLVAEGKAPAIDSITTKEPKEEQIAAAIEIPEPATIPEPAEEPEAAVAAPVVATTSTPEEVPVAIVETPAAAPEPVADAHVTLAIAEALIAEPAVPLIPKQEPVRTVPAMPVEPVQPVYAPAPPKAVEVQRYIGINDRFQFIAQLFGSDAAAYEATIQRLNTMTSKHEAQLWLEANVAPQYWWPEEDSTVMLFYDLLSQAFSAR